MALSHYLNEYWSSIVPHGITRPQWVIKENFGNPLHWKVTNVFNFLSYEKFLYYNFFNVKTETIGAHFRNNVSIVIQSDGRLELYMYSVTLLLDLTTLQNFAAVMPCAKFHSNHLTISSMRSGWKLYRIWTTMEKLFVKWGPVYLWLSQGEMMLGPQICHLYLGLRLSNSLSDFNGRSWCIFDYIALKCLLTM